LAKPKNQADPTVLLAALHAELEDAVGTIEAIRMLRGPRRATARQLGDTTRLLMAIARDASSVAIRLDYQREEVERAEGAS